jgi:anti-sigma B factor antagonist
MQYPPGADEDAVTIDTSCVEATGVVTVAGEVDVLSGTRLRRAIGDVLDGPGTRSVVVDLSAVTLLGSTGLAVLVDAHRQAQQRGHEVVLVVDPARRAVPLALQAAGIAALFTTCADVAEALRSLC